MNIRAMTAEDWPSVSKIYLQGIEGGNATFETELPTYQKWDAVHVPCCRLVLEDEEGIILGWACLSPVSHRACFRGVAEVSIYVSREAAGQGVGSLLLGRLIEESEENGFWSLLSVVFAENAASLRLHEKMGFRVIGRRERIAQDMTGRWRDSIMLEKRSERVGK